MEELENLDRISKDVLIELSRSDELTSSELRDRTEASSTKQIKYRIREYLRPAGWVDEWQQGRDEYGRDLPVVFMLTSAGEEFVGAFEGELADTSNDSVEERVARLERQVRSLRKQVRDEQPES